MMPRQVALVLSAFPVARWSVDLVAALNQFSQDVVQALILSAAKYKTLTLATGANVADSFPIDFPVDATPLEVRVALVVGDAGFGDITVKWAPTTISARQAGVRVRYVTGLSANTSYTIRLAYQ